MGLLKGAWKAACWLAGDNDDPEDTSPMGFLSVFDWITPAIGVAVDTATTAHTISKGSSPLGGFICVHKNDLRKSERLLKNHSIKIFRTENYLGRGLVEDVAEAMGLPVSDIGDYGRLYLKNPKRDKDRAMKILRKYNKDAF